MIIDTTQTKTERELQSEHLVPTFEIASNRPSWEVNECRDDLRDGCSCHIAPPCSYCTSHCPCEWCDKSIYNDYLIEVGGRLLCEDCADTCIVGMSE